MLTKDLTQELALVTGATGGIGKATCLALASLGCSIAVHYNTAVDVAKDLVAQLARAGVRAEAFKADLSHYDQVCGLALIGARDIATVRRSWLLST